jgi:Asp-tRNA(Asn)/Glu-tRNA(Gln) amidotransferase A subunit family amidase
MERADYTEAMIEPCRLGAKEAALRIERGELQAQALIASCLERIAAREKEVGAWTFVNREISVSKTSAPLYA